MSQLFHIRQAMRRNVLVDEDEALGLLVRLSGLGPDQRRAISVRAADLVRSVRANSELHLMEAFLSEYGLSTQEGVALMCLAEALLRVPDAETMDELIRDKIAPHDWSAHSGESASIFVNASTWALMLTGRVLDEGEGGVERTLRGMIRRLGEPVIRRAVGAAMREMGDQFVLGRTIGEAVKRGKSWTAKGYLYSYDMLGEAARTDADALRYHRAYAQAIEALRGEASGDDISRNPGISVKLSALHPRYEAPQAANMLPVMHERLASLVRAAMDARMGINIDAEEADRLDLSLDVVERVFRDPALAGWDGFGVVVQAYGRRAPQVIDWLYQLASETGRRLMVRLVKGAYWDTEIKRAQVMGLPGYPVFTRKANTDVSYMACAAKLLSMRDRIYPQFATHNAHTVAAILDMAGGTEGYEFQRLHGMGDALHEIVRRQEGTRCRIYAPVGAHSDLLAYLVRRLLENGANSSFVHQIVDETVTAEEIARDPFETIEQQGSAHNPAVPMPRDIFGTRRANSAGWDLTDVETVEQLEAGRSRFAAPHRWQAAPVTAAHGTGDSYDAVNPARLGDVVGHVTQSSPAQVAGAIGLAEAAQPRWAATPIEERAAILRRAADLYEENSVEFFALACREAGKTMADGVAEVREAVDFLRYYAGEAARAEVGTRARGVIACISPWNFPLAIFTGQIAAALVTGNAVVAKPAEQTPLIACLAVRLLHQAGVPADVLHLVIGDGPSVGGPLTADPRIAGVCFTGSLEVARIIERQLAAHAAPDAMMIAETGGLNAMIVDSTALPEQAVRDMLASAFQSAGQRCSALRILYVQEDVKEKVLEMLRGAMAALRVGDPWLLSTDVGPVIDEEARAGIAAYCKARAEEGRLIDSLPTPGGGRFVAPHILGVSGIAEMEREIFGPVLHVASFSADEIDAVIDAINARGYGLTFGLHTRIDERVQRIIDRIHAGNIYVNRNQIGAVVGSQPFGGEGLSGTGPKAGGPLYLRRFRKPATPVLPALGGTAAALPGLPEGAAEWAGRPDRISILRRHLRGRGAEALAAIAGVDAGPIDLPGPTGESNVLALVPRGTVVCAGPTTEALLSQVIQALGAGNAVIAVAPGAPAVLAPLISRGMPLAAADGIIDPAGLAGMEIAAVAIAGDETRLRAVRQALAARDGPIVGMITALIDPLAYFHERSVCVDTTAAGGNASLLSAS